MTGQKIKIPAADGGEFDAYLALPPENSVAGPAPLIVMLHEIFGVTDWVTETADIFAAHGYMVVAPDMFWRLEPNFNADHRDAAQREQGLRYRGMIDHDKAVDDIAAVISALKSRPECNGKIGVTGFCMGGTLTYLAAARLPIDAAVIYYGTEVHKFLDEGGNISCPTVLHMGDADEHVPLELARTIIEALEGNPNIAFHMYEAGHAFSNTHRPGHFDQTANDAAHARTFAMFDGLK